jgi:Protein of unknown function (DUF3551)
MESLSRTGTEKFEAVREGIMKVRYSRRYLNRAAGDPCPPVDTALFQPIAFVKRFMNNNSYSLVIAVGLVTSSLQIAGPAAADPYRWCAVERTGGTNCGFTTIEQCRATVSGIGGFCQPNQFYTGPDKTPTQRSQKQAKRKPPAEHRAQERRAPKAPAPERRVPEDRFQ